MDATFLQDRITAIKAQITAYDAAIIALIANPTQSYTLDTGQTRQTVTRFELKTLQDTQAALVNQLAVMEARLYGNGVKIGIAGW